MDTVVRYMVIEEFYGKCQNSAFELYEKMQHARCSQSEGRLEKFKELIKSVEAFGFEEVGHPPMKVNQNLMLLDGSHRFALALYHGVKKMPIIIEPNKKKVFYSLEWFRKAGFSEEEQRLMRNGLKRIQEKSGLFFIAIIWPPAEKYFDEISEVLKKEYGILWQKDILFTSENDFAAFIKGCYTIDDIAEWKVLKKLEHMQHCSRKVRVLALNIENPSFRTKSVNNQPLSRKVEAIKKEIRGGYASKIENYFYDIILHVGDNYHHTEYLQRLLCAVKKDIDLVDFLVSIKDMRYVLTKTETPYMPDNFPQSYPFNKDIDILCDENDYEEMCAIALHFSKKYSSRYDVRSVTNDHKYRVRFEVGRFLCFQIDISCRIDGLKRQFIPCAISRKKLLTQPIAFYVTSDLDEMLLRLYEYASSPQKQHHYQYLLQKKELLNEVDLTFIESERCYSEIKEIAQKINKGGLMCCARFAAME